MRTLNPCAPSAIAGCTTSTAAAAVTVAHPAAGRVCATTRMRPAFEVDTALGATTTPAFEGRTAATTRRRPPTTGNPTVFTVSDGTTVIRTGAAATPAAVAMSGRGP